MKKALISVFNKEKLEIISRYLIDKGFEIYSTKGTKKFLEEKGINVKGLEALGIDTEGLAGGRIKTMHPLLLEKVLSKEGDVFEVIIVNLYPFEEKLNEGLKEPEIFEYIDIGGVTLIRSACKNILRTIPIVDPEDYEYFIERYNEGLTESDRFYFAQKAIEYVNYYDSVIAGFFREKSGRFPYYLNISGKRIFELRYGENPSQKAFVYGSKFLTSLHGKKLSYNNLLDIEGAFLCVSEFEEPACVIVKHTTPCGVAQGETLEEAFERAFLSDPESAFGGIVAFNKEIDVRTAERVVSNFFEVVIAPSFDEEALPVLKKRKNLRIINSSELEIPKFEARTVFDFILFQEKMKKTPEPSEWELKTSKEASSLEIEDLYFALKVVKYVKSNAICVAKAKRTLGIGAGQPSRIRALEIALTKAKSFGLSTVGAVLASDAFFPFRDSIDLAAREGITAIVVPGGSIRDEEVIKAAEENGISLYFIKERFFRH